MSINIKYICIKSAYEITAIYYIINLLFLLLLSGDIESNPGPTVDIIKLVSASKCIEHESFNELNRLQCSLTSLVSLYWASVKRVAICSTSDLDHILSEGNKLDEKSFLDKSLYIPTYISVEDKIVELEASIQERGHIFSSHSNFLASSRKCNGDGILGKINGHSYFLLFCVRNSFISMIPIQKTKT